MALLIPSLGSCTFDSGGERRLAERLIEKLEDDYLCWYNVPLGAAVRHPDFIVFHPRRGLLILEVKDWKKGTIRAADRQSFTLSTARGEVAVENPLEQARQYAQAAVQVLQRDPQLVFSSGREAGKLRFPWSYGVVFPNLTRRQFEEGGLGEVIPEARVICQDEMLENVEPEAFQQRLWAMFSVRFESPLSPAQIDRLRWALFPEVRIPATQGELFAEAAPPPDLVRVMDLQQEQLARSLGEGHRVIHGVAGSGKTLILLYRAEHLARLVSKPILVLCYNEALARRLASLVAAKGLAEAVWVHHFHHWCRALLAAHEIELPPRSDNAAAYCAGLVERALAAQADGRIEGGQYAAILIDEGHDFAPDWFRLLVPLVDPQTNSLLVLYDDAQAIYADAAEGQGQEGALPRRRFSFKSVGVQAQGRTTVLRINYRNPEAILRFARATAWPALAARDAAAEALDGDDGAPLLEPLSAGGAGEVPQVVQLPSAQAEAEFVVRHLQAAHRAGTPWGEMAVIYRDYYRDAKTIRKLLPRHGVPTVYFDDATHADDEDKVTLITMHSCKGLEYSLVVIPATDRLAVGRELSAPEARLLYVAMTRATRELVLCGVGGEARAG